MIPDWTKISNGCQPSLPLKFGSRFLSESFKKAILLTFVWQDDQSSECLLNYKPYVVHWNHLSQACSSQYRFALDSLVHLSSVSTQTDVHELFRKYQAILVCSQNHQLSIHSLLPDINCLLLRERGLSLYLTLIQFFSAQSQVFQGTLGI